MEIGMYVGELSGHPEVYARTISRILGEEGHNVHVFTCKAPEDESWDDPTGKLEAQPWLNLVYLPQTSMCSDASPEALRAAVIEYEIDKLLLTDADSYREYLSQMIRGEAARFPCWTAGIFSKTAHWYPGEPFYFSPKGSTFTQLRSAIGKVWNSCFKRTATRDFLFESLAGGSNIIDAAIVKDERIVECYDLPFVWMPEIFEDPEDIHDTNLKPDEIGVANFLDEYDENSQLEILLFYGTGAWYKGYDYFLKLAVLDSEVMAIHIGRPAKYIHGKRPDYDVTELRLELLKQNRLLETGCYASPVLTRKAFSKIKRFVSFHRLSGSSGTVLQSIKVGNPVLTPNAGLLGHRTRKHKLGATYQPLNIEDLHSKWLKFKSAPVTQYKPHLKKYSDNFGDQAIRTFFVDLFGNHQLKNQGRVF